MSYKVTRTKRDVKDVDTSLSLTYRDAIFIDIASSVSYTQGVMTPEAGSAIGGSLGSDVAAPRSDALKLREWVQDNTTRKWRGSMFRAPNTIRTGTRFDQQTIELVWRKGHVVLGIDPNSLRKDACGAWMARSAYGTTGEYGWEVDHIMPVAKGGSDDLANLQPLQWRNNQGKGDNWPQWSCTVKAA